MGKNKLKEETLQSPYNPKLLPSFKLNVQLLSSRLSFVDLMHLNDFARNRDDQRN